MLAYHGTLPPAMPLVLYYIICTKKHSKLPLEYPEELYYNLVYKASYKSCHLFWLSVCFTLTSNFIMFLHCVCVTGTPKHVDYEKVKRDLISVPGVRKAHSLHIWSLTLNKTALSAHLVLGKLQKIYYTLQQQKVNLSINRITTVTELVVVWSVCVHVQ